MTPDIESKIFRSYPKMFSLEDGDAIQPVHGGICCGDGWANIIESFCAAVENYYYDGNVPVKLKKSSEDELYKMPTVIFSQIQEKFGTLHLYYSYKEHTTENGDLSRFDKQDLDLAVQKFKSYVGGAARLAEELSSVTCEISGGRGRVFIKDGYLRTLSFEEAEKNGYREPLLSDLD